MKVFDHAGFATDAPQPGERFVAKTNVWVTDPSAHPYRVEWLRYSAESHVPEEVRTRPHIAYHVDSIAAESAGLRVLIPPFSSVAGHVVGFYETSDHAVVELMEYKGVGNV